MEKLLELITEKTGLSEEKAQIAVEIVINFLKKKLPLPIADQIDSFLSGSEEEESSGGFGNLVQKGLGGILGKED